MSSWESDTCLPATPAVAHTGSYVFLNLAAVKELDLEPYYLPCIHNLVFQIIVP